MMSFEPDMSPGGQLIDWLKRSPGMIGILSGGAHHDEAPQGTVAPYMVISDVSDAEDTDTDGPAGVTEFELQIDIYADTKQTATTIYKRFRRQLHGYSGQIGSIHCQLAQVRGGFSERLPDVFLTRKVAELTLYYTER